MTPTGTTPRVCAAEPQGPARGRNANPKGGSIR